MKKIGLYLLNRKAYLSLERFLEIYGPEYISYAVIAKDKQLENDFSDEIKQLCKRCGIQTYSREELLTARIHEDFKVAIGWRWIISNPENLIVFHDSLLPKYRGFSPLVNMLINGEPQLGVTVLRASERYDEGDILLQKSVSIQYPIKIYEAIDKVSTLYGDLLIDLGQAIFKNEDLVGAPQDCNDASYSLWRDELDYNIDWNQTSSFIKRFIDSVGSPYAGASTTLNGKKIKIKEAEVMPDVKVESRICHIGKIIFLENTNPVVVCGEGLLRLKDIRNLDGSVFMETISFRTRFSS